MAGPTADHHSHLTWAAGRGAEDAAVHSQDVAGIGGGQPGQRIVGEGPGIIEDTRHLASEIRT